MSKKKEVGVHYTEWWDLFYLNIDESDINITVELNKAQAKGLRDQLKAAIKDSKRS